MISYNKRRYFTKEQREIAAKVDIRGYLSDVHPDLIKKEGGKYSRYLGKRSVSLSARGYVDNSTGEAGNGIDFLKTYLFDDNLVDAVLELYDYAMKQKNVTASETPILPKSADSSLDTTPSEVIEGIDNAFNVQQADDSVKAHYRLPNITSEPDKLSAVHSCLERHGITVDSAVAESVHAAQYPDEDTCFALFKSRETNYSLLKIIDDELGAFDYTDLPLPTSDADGYYIIGSMTPQTIYVCEGILAALSLREIRHDSEDCHSAAYASIAHGNNHASAARLSRKYPNAKIIIAFDNSESGLKFALKSPYKYIRPKDPYVNWNQQLLSLNRVK